MEILSQGRGWKGVVRNSGWLAGNTHLLPIRLTRIYQVSWLRGNLGDFNSVQPLPLPLPLPLSLPLASVSS